MKELDGREQAFVDHYIVHRNPTEAALNAGYAKSTAKTSAFTWIRSDKCPDNKLHVALEIERRLENVIKEADIDAVWVLKRLALLANFNIKKFLRVDSHGNAVYDFSEATDDDWYCISEYTVDEIQKGSGEDVYQVERIKLKSESKIQALLNLGKHVNVKAFTERVEVEVTDRSTAIEKARERVLKKRKGE